MTFLKFSVNIKACNHLIWRLLVNLDISLCGGTGNPLAHLEVILAIIKEVYGKNEKQP